MRKGERVSCGMHWLESGQRNGLGTRLLSHVSIRNAAGILGPDTERVYDKDYG